MSGSLARVILEDARRGLRLLGDQYGSLAPLDADCIAATGSGDSYAAALAAPSLAAAAGRGAAAAYDPLEAAALSEALAGRGCVLLALSVGGRTRTVVEAAKAYRAAGGRVVAVTADPDSPLAAVARETALLAHGGTAGGVGAGRHLVMLAALARLLGAPEPRQPEGWEEPGWCKGGESLRAVHAGAGEAVSSALYAALKAYEVLGAPVHWWSLEQLVHAPVYAMPPRIVVYLPHRPGSYVWEAVEALREAGYTVELAGHRGDPASTLVAQAAEILACTAKAAGARGEPAYRGHPGLERLTRLIYG